MAQHVSTVALQLAIVGAALALVGTSVTAVRLMWRRGKSIGDS